MGPGTISRPALAAGLVGLLTAAPVQASVLVEVTATLANQMQAEFSGEAPDPSRPNAVLTDTAKLAITGRTSIGGGPATATANVTSPSGGPTPAQASVTATSELASLQSYSIQIADPDITLGYLNNTSWFTKLETHLRIDPTDFQAVDYSRVTRTRANETHAVLAIAPNSASGFSTGAEPSRGNGNGIRLLLTGFFEGGIYDDNGAAAMGAPQYKFGDGFSDSAVPGANNVGPTFEETLMAFNQGLTIAVDLDAAGVAVGDEYSFFQRYVLGVGPGVILDGLELAFVDIDPIYGIATVPEPGSMALLALGTAWLAVGRGRRRVTGSRARCPVS